MLPAYFILRKRNSGGYIALDATQRIGYTNGDYNLAWKAYVGNTRYTLFAGTDLSDIKSAETTSLETIHFPSLSYSYLPSHLRKNSQYAQFRVRNKNDKRTLSATFSFVRAATPEDSEASTLIYFGTTCTPADRASAYVKLSWSFDFGKKTSRDNLSIDRTISTGVIRAE